MAIIYWFIGLYAPATAGINESKVRIWLDRSDIHTDGFVYVLRAGILTWQLTGYESSCKWEQIFCLTMMFLKYFEK